MLPAAEVRMRQNGVAEGVFRLRKGLETLSRTTADGDADKLSYFGTMFTNFNHSEGAADTMPMIFPNGTKNFPKRNNGHFRAIRPIALCRPPFVPMQTKNGGIVVKFC